MADLIKQFNLSGDRKSILKKALSTATNSGEALVPQKLEKIITNTVVRLSPEIAMIESEYDPQLTHEFNQLKALPAAGGAMGESANTIETASQYARESVRLKVVRRKGKISNFLQDASAGMYDAVATEIESHLTAHVYDLVHYIIDGDKDLTPANAEKADYEYDGLDKFIQKNRINGSGAILPDLDLLDEVIDRNIELQGMQHKKAFLMSPQMLSRVSKLLTNVRLNQGIAGNGITQVNVDGGWRLNAYRDIPIITSGSMRNASVMPAVTLGTATSGGSIPAGTYYIRVAYVGLNGESQAEAVEQNITTTGATSTITITLPTPPAGAMKYIVYLGTATGVLTKNAVVSAFEYNASGEITGNVSAFTLKTIVSTLPTASQQDTPLLGTAISPEERIILWDMDKYQGLGKFPFTNRGGDKFNGLVTVRMLAETDDFIPMLVKTYGALCPSFEATSSIIRNIKSK